MKIKYTLKQAHKSGRLLGYIQFSIDEKTFSVAKMNDSIPINIISYDIKESINLETIIDDAKFDSDSLLGDMIRLAKNKSKKEYKYFNTYIKIEMQDIEEKLNKILSI